MSIALDTNVIIDVVGGNTEASSRAAAALSEHGGRTALTISPIVFSELFAHPGWSGNDVYEFLRATSIAVHWDMSEAVYLQAGIAFAHYARRRFTQKAGLPRRILADFLIGAHAASLGSIITSDAAFYQTNFPDLKILAI